ncbi:MAG TPA: type II secretion system F family protein [Acidobacteriota bacterium]|nr:type II secretion system F family protein [Acidobacteriota bacterium]
MPEFTCRLGTPAGELITKVVEADGAEELKLRLEREGFRVFAIDLPGANLGGIFSFSTQGSVKLEEFFLFNQQFATLLRAGLPMLQALGVLVRRLKPGMFRTVLEDVERRIRSGASLSEALTAHPKVFPRLYTASILAGERSGELDRVLLRYINHAKVMTELRRKLKKTLTYPVILIVASAALVGLLTTYVIPKFATLYESSNTKLPLITEYVVGISKYTQENLAWIAPLVLVAGVAFTLWKRTPAGELAIDRFLLKLPVMGDVIRQTTISRMARSMATLLAGGLTLLESLEISTEVVSNRVLSDSMVQVMRQIREGQSLIDSLEQAGWVPAMAMDMIGVGEKSGSLGTMLDEVAVFYDAELDLRLSTLTTLIEPIVLIFMAAVVLTVLLALYLPILQFVGDRPTQ